MQKDHCQDPNAIPLTYEEISNLVFKKKYGIVKELCMRPSSSLVTTASSNSLVEYIQRLENEIIELKDAKARNQGEWARYQEAWAKQEEVQKNILKFLRSKGYDDALTYKGGTSSSENTYWLVLYFSNWPTLHGVTTFFDALFEINCIILHLKIYICFLQLIH